MLNVDSVLRRGCQILVLCSLIPAVVLAAGGVDRRVAEAAQARNWNTVADLIKRHVDVNAAQADGATALQWAAHWNDASAVKLLLKAGANPNLANDLGVTALELAAENGGLDVVKELLASGANPHAANQANETVLMKASETGNADVVKALLAKGANPNTKERTQDQTALMWAAAEAHTGVVKALIDAGADVHARSKGGSTPLLFAARSGDIESARLCLAAGADVNEALPDGNTALLVAAGSGHGDLGIMLLDKGANANAATSTEGLTPLHALVLKRPFHAANWKRPPDNLALAKALLAHGANPNARSTKPVTGMGINVTGAIQAGSTPIVLAARVADLDMMHILIDAHADVKIATNAKLTALMAASGLGRAEGNEDPIAEVDALEAVKMLTVLGSDVNAIDQSGQSALHGAVNNGYNTVIEYLYSKGANLNVKDKDGWTPLNIAEIYRNNFREHKESAALLRKLGAIESTPPPKNNQ
jgi:ankyrin repeat protein